MKHIVRILAGLGAITLAGGLTHFVVALLDIAINPVAKTINYLLSGGAITLVAIVVFTIAIKVQAKIDETA